ncbi:MAG: hypothetical protein ACE361_00450 [Aureliella sp.]
MSSVVAGHPSSGVVREKRHLQALEGMRLFKWYCLVLVPLFGIGVGAVIGYAVHRVQPRIFKATALIEVNNREPIGDEYRLLPKQHVELAAIPHVMSSQAVLRLAVEKGRLYEELKFGGRKSLEADHRERIVAELMEPGNLSVDILNLSAEAAHLEVAYSVDDAELSALVVNSIVDAYSEYVNDEWQTNGNQLYNLLVDAQEKLSMRHNRLNQERHIFWERNRNIDFSDDDRFRNPYLLECERIRSELTDLGIDRLKKAAAMEIANDALKTEENMGVALVAIGPLSGVPPVTSLQSDATGEIQESAKEQLAFAIETLRQQLLSISEQEKRLRPLLASVRERAVETSRILNQDALLAQEIELIGSLRDEYSQRIQEIEFYPARGSVELKSLTSPSIGEFEGPYVAGYLTAGAIAGGIPALLFAMMLYYGANGAIAQRAKAMNASH